MSKKVHWTRVGVLPSEYNEERGDKVGSGFNNWSWNLYWVRTKARKDGWNTSSGNPSTPWKSCGLLALGFWGEWDLLEVPRSNPLHVGVQAGNPRWRRCRTSSSTDWPLAGALPRRSSTCHGRTCQLSTSLTTPHRRTWRHGCSQRGSTLCESLGILYGVVGHMHCVQFGHCDVTDDSLETREHNLPVFQAQEMRVAVKKNWKKQN